MSPQFSWNPTETTTTLEVLQKGDYEMILGNPSIIIGRNDDGSVKNFGVRYALTDAKNPKNKAIMNCYMHNDGGQSFSKRFFQAALGFGKGKEQEALFNQQVKDWDWRIDTEGQELGDAYSKFSGQHLMVNLDVKANPQSGDEQQDFKGFRPLGA